MAITHANTERVGDDLVVTWRGALDASVFLSTDPDDAGIDVRAPASPGVAILELPDPATRYYAHLFADGEPFVVTAERRLPLEGAHNFRDLGGYPTPTGRTRWGQVFRADNPGLLTMSDLGYLTHLNVSLSCDYRGDTEVAEAPSKLAEMGHVRYERLPISSTGPNNLSAVAEMMAGRLHSFSFDDMTESYGRILANHAGSLATVIRYVADPGQGPLIFNCSGGKDRAGLTAALLLLMVGVDEATVLDDYEMSSRYLPTDRLAARYERLATVGIERDDVRGMFELQRSTLKTALIAARAQYGSIEAYLRDHMGLSDDEFAGVHRKLVSGPA